ncbi:MAG: aldo/keto reductase [Alphaproteobacteria bacterium]|nr:aldo/keto reductase [Alphaproteobacteria bacterium]
MAVERQELAPGYEISRLLRGGWQLAGGHGRVDRERAVDDMAAFVDQGVTTFDCADIYTGAEEMIGDFRSRFERQRGRAALRTLKVHTKFVPDWDKLGKLDRGYVESIIDRSLIRLKMERLDLVQFHWWNYAVPGAVEAALILRDLQRAGKIDRVGATNFDTPNTKALIDAGVPLVSMQIQYSLLDPRAENGLVQLAREKGFGLLCYGTLAGGFLTDTWLNKPEPAEGTLTNRSLIKYKLIIDDFGGWGLFQELLTVLDAVARRHGVTIAAVAGRWMLDRPGVAGIIVGARYADHLAADLKIFDVILDAADRAAIDQVLARRQGPRGDTFELERDRNGRHGRIMKYNLNAA